MITKNLEKLNIKWGNTSKTFRGFVKVGDEFAVTESETLAKCVADLSDAVNRLSNKNS